MPEPAHDSEPVRAPDHNLDDLVATVAQLAAESRKQREILARLTEDQPPREDGEPDDADRPQDTASAPSRADSEPRTPEKEDSGSIVILALTPKAYAEELAALTNWVRNLLLPVYGREITASRPWCPQWHEHPEAVTRLHALWLAWQQLTKAKAGPTGPSTWHRDHLEPTLHQLRSPDGPFSACTTNATRPHHRLLPPPDLAGDRDDTRARTPESRLLDVAVSKPTDLA